MNEWKVLVCDVWGNEEDGWEVNDVTVVGCINLPDEPTDDEIMEQVFTKPYTVEIDSGVSDECRVEFIRIRDGKPVAYTERMMYNY